MHLFIFYFKQNVDVNIEKKKSDQNNQHEKWAKFPL